MTQDMDVKKQTAIKELIALGKKKGKLTLKEMSDALESIDMESDELDRLYEELEKAGIEFHQVTILVVPRQQGIVSPRTSTCCSNTLGERSDGTLLIGIKCKQEVCLQDIASLLKLYSINRAVQGAGSNLNL